MALENGQPTSRESGVGDAGRIVWNRGQKAGGGAGKGTQFRTQVRVR